MDVYYEGVNISDSALVKSCRVHDTCGGRADGLEIVFEDAAKWLSWGPKEDDEIVITNLGYESGAMYVNTITPEGGKYRIFATSLRCAARKREYRSYRNKTLGEIMSLCALNTGMESRHFGLDAALPIRYIEQNGESAARFLHRLMTLEGAVLKCVQGRYTGIGISWAQERRAGQTLALYADRDGTAYIRKGGALQSLAISMPGTRVSATDTAVKNGMSTVKCGLPVSDAPQAGRWARGLLISHNRQNEILTLDSVYNPAMTAMTRVDVTGGTDADGEWLVDHAEHDMIDETTRTIMYRCVTTVI